MSLCRTRNRKRYSSFDIVICALDWRMTLIL